MVWITTMLAALIGLMFFASMATTFSEMHRERAERNSDLPPLHLP